MLSCPGHKGTGTQAAHLYSERCTKAGFKMVPGRTGAQPESGGRQSHCKREEDPRCPGPRPQVRSAESGQAGSTGAPGPAEFTPEAPESGTRFSAQAGHTLGGEQHRPEKLLGLE